MLLDRIKMKLTGKIHYEYSNKNAILVKKKLKKKRFIYRYIYIINKNSYYACDNASNESKSKIIERKMLFFENRRTRLSMSSQKMKKKNTKRALPFQRRI